MSTTEGKGRISKLAAVEWLVGFVALVVMLVLLIPKITSSGPEHASYRSEVATSIEGAKRVRDNFLAANARCRTAACSDNVASHAVDAMGPVLSGFNVVNFPERAQAAGAQYDHDLSALQQLYLSTGFLASRPAIAQNVVLVKSAVEAAIKSGQALEAKL